MMLGHPPLAHSRVLSNATAPSNSTTPASGAASRPSGWGIYWNKVVLGERHFHFSIAFLSLLASALVIAVIVDMARRRNRNTCGFFHHVKDFDMLMIPLFLCQFGNSWIQMAAAVPRWGGLKFSPSTVDDSHNDDTPFDPFMRGLYMSEFFSKFVFPDVSCLVINVLSFSVVWIVCRQRKLPVLEGTRRVLLC